MRSPKRQDEQVNTLFLAGEKSMMLLGKAKHTHDMRIHVTHTRGIGRRKKRILSKQENRMLEQDLSNLTYCQEHGIKQGRVKDSYA